jgi:prepilin peptidase CpaA
MPSEIDMTVILLFLSGATLFDFFKKRIPNLYIIAGMAISLIRVFIISNGQEMEKWMYGLIWPTGALFILFIARVLGAGDIKIIAVVSSIVPTDWAFLFIAITFVTAGIYSMTVMIFKGELLRRLFVLGDYLNEIAVQRKILHYPKEEAESGKIRMAPFMFLSAFFTELIVLIWR